MKFPLNLNNSFNKIIVFLQKPKMKFHNRAAYKYRTALNFFEPTSLDPRLRWIKHHKLLVFTLANALCCHPKACSASVQLLLLSSQARVSEEPGCFLISPKRSQEFR